MNRVAAVWAVGRVTLQPLVTTALRLRTYGKDRVPRAGGVVLAFNHFHWLDPAVFGAASPRPIHYMAKVEAHRIPGVGQLIRSFGAFAVRRGESDREAVRLMRQAVRSGEALGLFVEGTRQRGGVPGPVQPGAALIAVQEGVVVVPAAVHGTERWSFRRPSQVSVAWGEPMRFDGLPRNARGYREASAEIQRELRVLWDWLVEVHAQGRPRHATPPS